MLAYGPIIKCVDQLYDKCEHRRDRKFTIRQSESGESGVWESGTNTLAPVGVTEVGHYYVHPFNFDSWNRLSIFVLVYCGAQSEK